MSQTHRDVVASDDGKGTIVTREVVDAPQDSIELSVNAKGEPSWSVKAYARDAGEAEERLSALRAIAEQHARDIRAGKGAQ